jgi:ribosomal protein S18 acetylase RimI-like enzyme
VAAADVIRVGREKARTGLWRGDHRVAYLAPVPELPAPSADFVRRCLDILASRGFSRVVTAALSPFEQMGFLAAGFEVEEHLLLLTHDLSRIPVPPPSDCDLRRARRRDRDAVLALDNVAFPPFWRLDGGGLDEALDATPRTRFRLAEAPGGGEPLRGYAVCGRSGRRGFVQRLAVHPTYRRRHIGAALVVDGLHWFRRRGVSSVVVNTQTGNDAAVALYERLGFRKEASGLSVLSTGLRP